MTEPGEHHTEASRAMLAAMPDGPARLARLDELEAEADELQELWASVANLPTVERAHVLTAAEAFDFATDVQRWREINAEALALFPRTVVIIQDLIALGHGGGLDADPARAVPLLRALGRDADADALDAEIRRYQS